MSRLRRHGGRHQGLLLLEADDEIGAGFTSFTTSEDERDRVYIWRKAAVGKNSTEARLPGDASDEGGKRAPETIGTGKGHLASPFLLLFLFLGVSSFQSCVFRFGFGWIFSSVLSRQVYVVVI